MVNQTFAVHDPDELLKSPDTDRLCRLRRIPNWHVRWNDASRVAVSVPILENMRRKLTIHTSSLDGKIDRTTTRRLLRSIRKSGLSVHDVTCRVTSSTVRILGFVGSHAELKELALIGRRYSAGRKLELQVEVRPQLCNVLISPRRDDHQNNSRVTMRS